MIYSINIASIDTANHLKPTVHKLTVLKLTVLKPTVLYMPIEISIDISIE